jgi:tetratricopeptide (TPR) repeat protein
VVSATDLRPASEPSANAIATAGKVHFRKAQDLQNSGDWVGALSEYDSALSAYPQFEEALNNRGVVLGRLGRFADAIVDFTNSLSINPADPLVLFNRGLVRMLLGDYESALMDFNQSVELVEDPRALVNRAILLASISRHDEALHDLDKALSIDPNDGIARFNRSSVLFRLGQPKAALEEIDRALTANLDGELQEKARELRRSIVTALLKRLAKRGGISWSGGKPEGAQPRVKLDIGRQLSDVVIESRR